METTQISPATFLLGGEFNINRVGYGAMQLTGNGVFGDATDRPNAIKVLQQAVASGVNFIDTAAAYGPGTNERLIADALHPYQKGLIIATKGGFQRPGPNQWIPDGRPEWIAKDIDASLKNLKTDVIDLWQLHRIDPNIPVEETLAPVVAAVKAGKIKHVGLSEVNIEQIQQAEKILPIVSVQNLYNLGNRQWESVLDYTAEKGIAFIPWYPLASGPHTLEEKISKIAARHNATTAQIALAWLLKRASNILLIPGTKSIAHLEENLKAGAIELSEEDFQLLSK
ncbi:aldo/keto reductase [Chitinophaga ginsengisegetis]|uniref:aldo/keto reductase n=1 Tax=Chitinophaga ginsengisegetis TaxID=393003 RepID=UPI000DB9686C|nr:aldo/keto reductase [Chitinophaga ginsengisegetis]MDR6567413.1 aryl-alcohol dehydrogenase-like predicted oxidoreductase [Chitinophaga ginsengisegetis]MDR6647144.1 aryl-alcohol dehydrogenase-like predicted oxidoreductase [Chitinophaga ginsengisegetis]MDR6653493.1 aryl-alcohol dehydrogenase-like predicted oxidoreductase [Chitinophaga ginsengisegetis]